MSSRNNQDRFGAPDQGAQATAPTIEDQPQTGLSFTVPVEMVSLPSKGQFYPEDHSLHNSGPARSSAPERLSRALSLPRARLVARLTPNGLRPQEYDVPIVRREVRTRV